MQDFNTSEKVPATAIILTLKLFNFILGSHVTAGGRGKGSVEYALCDEGRFHALQCSLRKLEMIIAKTLNTQSTFNSECKEFPRITLSFLKEQSKKISLLCVILN